MYLKSIEIQGFKSFANKLVFQFHNGITGIVGPNGSGKSNVADAVRWVLGEQRIKQLRGASMQDVIFSGTETRKPLSYAYVAITLDNSDHQLSVAYDEVTVARRIYRSGESEYLINGTACRLKDVNELFYDTGIGKEGYSIIGQGQIDKILSGKPEERRELFDEAAGIVKFKRRKAAACAKLENEKQNLVRVSDILGELEKQTGPLEKQSEVAKTYLRKKEELKNLDVNSFLLENKRLRDQLEAAVERLGLADGRLKESRERYEGIKAEYEQVQDQIEALDRAIEEARQGLSDTGLMRGRLEGQINVLREQINSATGSRNHLLNRREAVGAELENKSKIREQTLEEKSAIDGKVAALVRDRDGKRRDLELLQEEITLLNTRMEESKNAIIGELNQRATIKSRMGRFDTMSEQIHIRKSELNSRLLRAKSDEADREALIREQEQAFEELGRALAAMNEQEAAWQLELGDLRERLASEDGRLRDTQARYHQEKSKLEALSNLTERYEGYGGSVKKVMEQKEREPGIVGVVADIIKVDKRYETAIETALGGNIQNIVTRDEDTAKRMIGYLKTNRLGRATFLPLTSIEKPQEFKNPEALKEKGAIGLADELVSLEREFANVAKAMLGRILVVDTVDHAVKIARKYDYGIRMVTLEGELLVPGGAISGGAFKNNSNLLGRRREMEELEKKIRALGKDIDDIHVHIDQIKADRNKRRMDIEALKTDMQRTSIEQNTARINLMQVRERMAEEEAGMAGLRREEKEIEEQLASLESDKEAVRRALEDSEALEQGAQEEITRLSGLLEEKRRLESEALAQTGEWELKTEKMLQTQEFHQINLDRINGELERHQRELEEILTALAENEEEAHRREQSIRELELTIAASQDTQTEAEQKLKEDVASREKLAVKQKDFFRSREALAEEMNGLDKEVYRLGAQKEKLEEIMESQINYMWDEYEITLSDAAAIRDESMTDLAGMKKEIAALKEQIKRLGDVNVNAIEDYKNLMERYTFMKTQHDDLIEAQKTLEGIIQELDVAMRRQFTEKFQEISREFDKVFKELFGGGKGTLELMEDEDILEAGVRIIAQPPGKKLQNMMQLSGGEKALAAIALLFAIQNLKPSPFCLLDEIEAALDESNVGRFAKYLHKLTKSTQFIVITHRRGTMEQVDRLYGITMQEKGVSALVSVNLIDKDLDN